MHGHLNVKNKDKVFVFTLLQQAKILCWIFECVQGNAISWKKSMEQSTWEADRKVEFHLTTRHEGIEAE